MIHPAPPVGGVVLGVLWVVLGAATSMINTPSARLLRRNSTLDNRTAVFTTQFSLSHACFLLTYPVAGWVGAALGQPVAALVLTVVATLAAATALMLWRSARSVAGQREGDVETPPAPHDPLATLSPPASLRHETEPDTQRLEAASDLFRMLADSTRLYLLWLLARGESDVTALTTATGATRTSISQHLAKLRFAGLVTTRRDGRRIIYRLADGHLTRLVQEGLNCADHRVTGEPSHP